MMTVPQCNWLWLTLEVVKNALVANSNISPIISRLTQLFHSYVLTFTLHLNQEMVRYIYHTLRLFSAASGPLSLLPNEADYKGADTNKAESNSSDGPPPQNPNAQAILNSFPLLDFMQSPILSSRPTKL